MLPGHLSDSKEQDFISVKGLNVAVTHLLDLFRITTGKLVCSANVRGRMNFIEEKLSRRRYWYQGQSGLKSGLVGSMNNENQVGCHDANSKHQNVLQGRETTSNVSRRCARLNY